MRRVKDGLGVIKIGPHCGSIKGIRIFIFLEDIEIYFGSWGVELGFSRGVDKRNCSKIYKSRDLVGKLKGKGESYSKILRNFDLFINLKEDLVGNFSELKFFSRFEWIEI